MRRFLVLLALATPASLIAQASPDSLAARVRNVATPISLTPAGELSGPGGEALIARVRESQFVLLGEEHGVSDVPRLAAALWRAWDGVGNRHLAIEVGEPAAARLEAELRADSNGAAYRRFFERHWPGVPFYFWREDAALLRAAIASTPGQRDVLWGLDSDILADRYLASRLRELAGSAAARRLVDSAEAVMDSAFQRAAREQNPGLFYMFGGSPALFARLREGLHPGADSEADRILGLMAETLTINQLFFSGQGYASNLRRASLLRRQFLRRYSAARAADGRPPRVLFKFGAAHLMRGLNPSNQFDLGTLVPDLALTEGRAALSIHAMSGKGGLQARFDPQALRSVEVPAESGQDGWARPFLDAADSTRWTLFDLRALRPALQGQDIDSELRRIVYGTDLLVVLSGSGPQHDLVPNPRQQEN